MIFKEREEEIMLDKLIVLEQRLAVNHPMKEIVIKAMKIKRAEVNGERSLDYPLQFITEDVLILRNG